ncbi:hypothetical protein K470DRAFT_283138 [Piedraia hortae CBS 480.64]|uniref:FAD-binding domain-containing protein n=1 Tax=Piedraia hortae CBS 480.64 TaxID=1314780 RepID=A0A6A7BTE4_9PEZI|nr:hypothetical protein K470DRAFT_283138 [Piedraia hortae CBS 480.64]
MHSPPVVETPYLIVGAGPAGAGLACFLASHGLKGIIISAANGTAKEPRAHITNPATVECLRDIGLQEEAVRASTTGDSVGMVRWCHDMIGEEFARAPAWHGNPGTTTQLMEASPCDYIDLPQSMLEPILIRRATGDGWKVRYNTRFVKYERSSPQEPFYTEVIDETSNQTFIIKSKYIFGCDGGRSTVVEQMKLPFTKRPTQGHAMNIFVEADLSRFMGDRKGFIHFVVQPEQDCPLWARVTGVRMVRPWHQWMFVIILPPTTEELAALPSDEEFTSLISKWIGDNSIPVKILSKTRWRVNDTVAERYDDGSRRIFGLGDAVHRHPPHNGLGSNTSIQDAYNLAWKVAYVEKGLAHEALLDTYNAERQPIGKKVVEKSTTTVITMFKIWQAMGVQLDDVKDRRAHFDELSAPTKLGRKYRHQFEQGVFLVRNEFTSLGIHLNQQYQSPAIITHDETGPAPEWPWEEYIKNVQRSTYPGHKLPHAELFHRISNKGRISTIDLAGHGAFCIITGIGGDAWKAAAKDIGARLGIPFNAYSIGWKQDWEDFLGDWSRLREIEEDGCLLCRPDRTIAWRSMEMRDDATEYLLYVVKTVLGIEDAPLTNGGGENAHLTNGDMPVINGSAEDTSSTNGTVKDEPLAHDDIEGMPLANGDIEGMPLTNGGKVDMPLTKGKQE